MKKNTPTTTSKSSMTPSSVGKPSSSSAAVGGSIVRKADTVGEPVLTKNVTCHSFNADRTMCAVSQNSHIIEIYDTTKKADDIQKWEIKYSLVEHTQIVTALDWAPKTNRLLSCSQDRNAYVWTFSNEAKEWRPELVLLRINRAATCCKWSPNEDKFAVGSGSKLVSICYFEKENKWWVAKNIKKPHKSTVLSVAWHPTNNCILATTCSDKTCRVFSAWVKGIDPKDSNPKDLGKVIQEYTTKGWCYSVMFSPSGTNVAFVGHDSCLYVADWSAKKKEDTPPPPPNEETGDKPPPPPPSEGEEGGEEKSQQDVKCVQTKFLPFSRVLYLSETMIAVIGWDFNPILFTLDESKKTWKCLGTCDDTKKKDSKELTAKEKFQKKDSIGTTEVTTIATRHKNYVNSLQPYIGKSGRISKFTTSSVDGRILFWASEECCKNVGAKF